MRLRRYCRRRFGAGGRGRFWIGRWRRLRRVGRRRRGILTPSVFVPGRAMKRLPRDLPGVFTDSGGFDVAERAERDIGTELPEEGVEEHGEFPFPIAAAAVLLPAVFWHPCQPWRA